MAPNGLCDLSRNALGTMARGLSSQHLREFPPRVCTAKPCFHCRSSRDSYNQGKPPRQQSRMAVTELYTGEVNRTLLQLKVGRNVKPTSLDPTVAPAGVSQQNLAKPSESPLPKHRIKTSPPTAGLSSKCADDDPAPVCLTKARPHPGQPRPKTNTKRSDETNIRARAQASRCLADSKKPSG